MDEIDITDSSFDLNQPNIVSGEGESSASSSSMYMYIAIAIGVLLLGYIVYTTFGSGKGKKVTFQDKLEQCYGDVCNAN
jgi:hypothetical protein